MKICQLFRVGIATLFMIISVFSGASCSLVSGDCPNVTPPTQKELMEKAKHILLGGPTPIQALESFRKKQLASIYSPDPAESLIKQGYNAAAIKFCYWAASRARNRAHYTFDPDNIYIRQRNKHMRCDCYHLSAQDTARAGAYVDDFNIYLKILFDSPTANSVDNRIAAGYSIAYDKVMKDSIETISSRKIISKCAALEAEYTRNLSTCRLNNFKKPCPTYEQHYCYLWGDCQKYRGVGWRQQN